MVSILPYDVTLAATGKTDLVFTGVDQLNFYTQFVDPSTSSSITNVSVTWSTSDLGCTEVDGACTNAATTTYADETGDNMTDLNDALSAKYLAAAATTFALAIATLQ